MKLELPVQDYLDIGSGGGLPSLPILLSGSVEGRALLVERVQKKSAALRRMIYALDLSAELPAQDFDQFSPKGHFGLVTIRLVKLTPGLLARVSDLLHPNGALVYYARPEIDLSSAELQARTYAYRSGSSSKYFTLFRKL
jgi:16S rRNA G527 N7-methylase RsmG